MGRGARRRGAPQGSALREDLMHRKTNPIFDSASHGGSSSRGDDYEVLHVSGTSGMRSPPDLSGAGGVQRSAQGRQVGAPALVPGLLCLVCCTGHPVQASV